MDMNAYALEVIARDRLDRARREAAVRALVATPHVAIARVLLRISAGLRPIGVGRRLREDHGRSGARGVRLGPRVA